MVLSATMAAVWSLIQSFEPVTEKPPSNGI
jgi:hypothetical protein